MWIMGNLAYKDTPGIRHRLIFTLIYSCLFILFFLHGTLEIKRVSILMWIFQMPQQHKPKKGQWSVATGIPPTKFVR